MDSSASQVGSRETSYVPSSHSQSKLKTYGFTIAIIMGIGGLALGAVGLAGYCHVGALRNMAQLDAIIMMAAGGGSGIILLIVVSTIKIRVHRSTSVPRSSTTHKWNSTNCIYGREAWKQWKNIEIVDVIPPLPTIDLRKKDKILLYIPKEIIVNGKKQIFNLKTLKEIAGASLICFNQRIVEEFGDIPASGGWVLIDIVIPEESRGKTYETQQKIASVKGCSLPHALEAATLNLMVFDLTGKRLYGQNPWTYTFCLEKSNGQYPLVVGGFGSDGLQLSHCGEDAKSDCYVVAFTFRT